MKSAIYLIPLLASIALPAAAQLDNTVEVTNEVKPVVNDANKINILPSVVETPVKHNKVEYQTDAQPMKQFGKEPVRDYSSDAAYNGNKRGYLQLAGGSHGLTSNEAAYQFDFSNHDVLNLDFTLDGFNGKTKEDWTSRFYKNRLAGKYNHRFDNGVDFFVKSNFENHLFNYNTEFEMLNQTDKQHNTLIDFCAGITPYEVGTFVLSGEASLKFFNQEYKTNYKDKYNETVLNAKGLAQYEFDYDNSAELGVELFWSGYNMDYLEGISHIHFTPHYLYNNDDIHLQLGVVAGTDGDIAPDVNFVYHLNSHSDLYVNAVGYDNDNDFRSISKFHPYFFFNPTMIEDETNVTTVEAEFHQIDAQIGYRFKGDKGFSGDFNLGYDRAENSIECDDISNSDNGLNYAKIVFCKSQRFYINADFTYAYKDKVKIDLKNQFNTWKYKKNNDSEWNNGSYTRPVLDLRWKADFKIIDNLHVGVNWEIGYYESPDQDTNKMAYERPTTNNIGASVRYAFPTSMPFSVFVRADNLLNQNYDRYFGYSNIGVNVMGGVALSF